jgi:hypothetical protein
LQEPDFDFSGTAQRFCAEVLMRRSWGVLIVLLSTFGLTTGAAAQTDPTRPIGRQATEFSLEQNYPNPFRAQTPTRIPFVLGERLFAEGAPVVVSMRVYNVLQQLVAVPTAISHPAGDAVAVLQLEYGQPGRHLALWDGRDQNGNPLVAGVYWVQLTVNGMSTNRRVFLAK